MSRRSPGWASGSGPERFPGISTELVARWLVGLRLVAISALLVGALLVQTTTDEILPIGPLVQVAGLTYVLSLVWIGLWIAGVDPRLFGGLQIAGDLVITGTVVYLTGGVWSPFPFLFLVTVSVAALMFGLRGALATAGAAFVVYGAMAAALGYGILPVPLASTAVPQLSARPLLFQLAVTGGGFALVALLTSYLAHSLQAAESQLRGAHEATARLKAMSSDVLRSVDSGVIAVDNDGLILLANPAAVRIIGGDRGLERRTLQETLPLNDSDWDTVFRNASSQSALRIELSVTGRDQELGLTVTPLAAEDGSPLGFVLHFRDLTAAREQARRERLRDRLAAAGTMAAGIAHEIRNPLASISGSAQVLGNAAALPDKDRRLLRIIVEESRRLSRIIEAFLQYARPPDPTRVQCDVARTLSETLDLFANSPEVTPGHRIDREIAPLPHPIEADEGQLRQAFYNLARNAIQAMPQGGTMRVHADVDGTDYRIRWSDQGVGMDQRQVEEIFQPFRAFRDGGTGLGLAVVYSIVTEHGGDIVVDSLPGEGCTFTIRLPLES